MNLIPVLSVQALSSRPRRVRFHVRRVLFVAAGIAVVMMSFAAGGAAGPSATGLNIFRSLSITLLFTACVLSILSPATDLARERGQRTLGLLFLSDISAIELLLSKLTVTFVPATLTVLSLLPLFILFVCLGGITVPQILVAYALIISSIFLGNCVGLYISSGARSKLGLSLSAIGAGLTVFLILPAYFSFTAVVSPFVGMMEAADPAKAPGALWNCLFDVGLGVFLLAWAWLNLRRKRSDPEWATDKPVISDAPAARRGMKRGGTEICPASNPVQWRDTRFAYGTFPRAGWLIMAGLALTTTLVLATVTILAGGRIGDLPATLLMASGVLPGAAFLFGATYLCGQAFSMERTNRIVDLLLVTDLSVDTIIVGKLVAVLRALFPFFIWSLASLVLLLIFQDIYGGIVTVCVLMDFISMSVAYPFLAVSLSFRYERHVALAVCMLVLISWNFVGRLLFVVLFNSLAGSFIVDCAFNTELLLVGSIIIEGTVVSMQSAGAEWR